MGLHFCTLVTDACCDGFGALQKYLNKMTPCAPHVFNTNKWESIHHTPRRVARAIEADFIFIFIILVRVGDPGEKTFAQYDLGQPS